MILLAISDPEFIPDEAAIINSLFREGLVCLHLRKPASTPNMLKALLSKIESTFIDRIAIHQHHDLAGQFGITRLHFTEKDRKLASQKSLEYLKSEGYLLSTSIHDLNETSSLSTLFSYTFFGPVFDSISKSGYKSALPADFFLAEEIKKIPVIALGGIDITNLKKVKAMNFDGAAVLGTLWENPPSAPTQFKKLKAQITQSPKGAPYLRPGYHPGNPGPSTNKTMIDKLQFISNQTKDISHLESIRLALEAGCQWIQLRMKNESPENILKTALEAKILTDNYQSKLIINDFPLIAKEVGAYGLHLGLNDMSIPDARKIVGNEMIIGGTANTLEDILNRIHEGADYVGLGPFRFTSTKQNLSPIVGLEGYRFLLGTLKELGYSIPVIAIGGINAEDIAAIKQTGVHGVAMSGSIIGAVNRKDLVQKINEIVC
jgi:thiamine-phosphate diphosphorylase